MTDEILEEKELRVADAKRRLAWFEEEYRELQRVPLVKEYFYLLKKRGTGLTKRLTHEEEARLDKIENLQEPLQYVRNESARIKAREELLAAKTDLIAYRRNTIVAQDLDSLPIQNRPPDGAATSEDTSPKSVVPGSNNNNEGKMEMNSVQPQLRAAELRQRKRGGNLNGHGETNKTRNNPD